ncbi:hypothetical protein J5N97_012241 [Dioscorea zingiberensis]|uniref:Uncharacterized protein n=1 Tax=Dioscorea zingiberensis TaxID=325984 RepID=A0A9D5CQP5_9LILI|nr:hypothetical protein J5N97_012241 [Dioscorea zingiberensis]
MHEGDCSNVQLHYFSSILFLLLLKEGRESMAWRAGRSHQQPPDQWDSGYDDYDGRPPPRPFERPGGRGAAGARHPPGVPPPRGHAPESHDEQLPPGGGGGRRDRNNRNNINDYVPAAAGEPSSGGQGRGGRAGSTARGARWTPPSRVISTDNGDSSSSSSSSDDDEPEFRDMDITIDNNRIMNANGAKIVTGLRVKRDLRVRIRNNQIGS